jgi:flagellar hook-associated protein 2
MSELKKKFADMDDGFDFAGLTVKNSQSSAFDIETSAAAEPAQHDITVTQVARPQRSLTDTGFADKNNSVIAGKDFNLHLTVGTAAAVNITIPANSTLEGAKDAINAAKAGITAQVIDSGIEGATDRYKIMITGQSGSSNAFSLSSANSALQFDTDSITTDGDPATTLQKATDAVVIVDGVSYTRNNNKISDIVPGVTLNLLSTTVGSSSVQLSRDTSNLKTKLQDMITAYNDVTSFVKMATDPKSSDKDFGASLVGNTAVKGIHSKIKQMVFGTANGNDNLNIRGLRDLGVKLQDDGTLTLDEKTFTANSTAYYDQSVVMLSGTANSGLKNEFGTARKGVAADMTSYLTTTMSASGALLQNSQSAEKKISSYQSQLTTLDTRMSALLKRYNQQFSAMESIVGRTKSMQTSLTSTFDGMMNAYKK